MFEIKKPTVYLAFGILCLLPVGLLFSSDVWFDEAYTLSLIKNSYEDMSAILAADMHPPLYYFALKFFCSYCGYSVLATKVFSYLGFIATLALGPFAVMPNYGRKTAFIYMLAVGAVPMLYYFGVQQRAYSWCIFFVTLCYIYAAEFIKERRQYRAVIFSVAGLAAAYCHTYALLAVAIIFIFTNIYIFYIRSRHGIPNILLADLLMLAGYLPQLFTLWGQFSSAKQNFWLQGIEPLSLVVLAAGIGFAVWVLWDKARRRSSFIFPLTVILGLQAVGLLVSVFVRPLYIARYSVVVLGVFALTLARIVRLSEGTFRKWACLALVCLNIVGLSGTCLLEYDGSQRAAMAEFKEAAADKQVVCLDSSFGIISHYFPNKRILVTYNQPWFSAFKNVESIEKEDLARYVGDGPALLVKNRAKALPDYLTEDFNAKIIDTFKADFNSFEVYLITGKE
ncbi:MAG: hypothetical protein J6B93_06835 [Clostridia bacterium]|nr:hypothetical protein [Clostridia bacterium]